MGEYLVKIILVLAGFALILGVIFINIDFSKMSEEELCRLSVLARGTSHDAVNSFIPLNCETKKVCVDDLGGGCDEHMGEEKSESVRLRGSSEEKAEEISRVISDEMFNCWSMMGQGRIDIFSNWKNLIGKPAENVCVVCSRIAFNVDSDEVIGEVNVQHYMERNTIPGSSLTYVEAFTNRRIGSFPNVDAFDFDAQNAEEHELEARSDEIAVIFSQINQENPLDVARRIGLAGGSATAGVFLSPVPGSRIVAGGLGLATVVGAGTSAYRAYQNAEVVAGYCGEFTTVDEEGSSGCSAVQVVPYSVSNVNAICQQIDGRP